VQLGVLVSGAGTILEAIVEAGIKVAVVVADRPCRGLEVAAEAGLTTELVARTSFGADFDRDAYTGLVVDALKRHDVDVVAMAGFGTIIPRIVDDHPDRVLNTHPSLLPAFPGWHAVRQALEHGVKVTGCTVHVVTDEVDAGRILAQEAVPVLADDTEATLHERIKAAERRIYPQTIKEVLGR
jgi:phosphoribosylglycinamide formyltransferase-1